MKLASITLLVLIPLFSICCKSPVVDPYPKFKIGSSTLSLSSPTYFTEVSARSPSLRNRVELFLPNTERFIALFVPNEEAEEAINTSSYVPFRYVILSTPKEYETKRVSKSKFSDYKTNFKKTSVVDKDIKDTQNRVNSFSDQERKGAGLPDYQVNVQGMKIIEFIEQDDKEFSLLYTLESKTTLGTRESTIAMASSASGLLLKRRILDITVHSRLSTSRDQEWVKSATALWLSYIRESNQ